MIQIEFNYKQQITSIQADLNDIFQNIINRYFQKSLLNPDSVYFLEMMSKYQLNKQLKVK